MELFADKEGRQFIRNKAGTTALGTLQLGENVTEAITLWLLDRPDTEGQPLTPAALAAEFDNIILSGRLATDLEGDLLFSVTEFTAVGIGAITSSSAASPTIITTAIPHLMSTGDEVRIAGHTGVSGINGLHTITRLSATTFSIAIDATAGAGTGGTFCGPEGHYEGTLNLNTAAMIAALTGKKTIPVLVDLEFTDDAATLSSRAIIHAPATAYRDIYRGTEPTPESGDPIYPLPDDLALRTVATKYRIKADGTFQLWNATQSKWHALTLSGAAGAEILAIGAGEV